MPPLNGLFLAVRPTIDAESVLRGGYLLLALCGISGLCVIVSCFARRPRVSLIAAGSGVCLFLCIMAVLYVIFRDNPEVEFHSSRTPDEAGGLAFLFLALSLFYSSVGVLLLASAIALITGLIRLLLNRYARPRPPVCPECGCPPLISTGRCPNCGRHVGATADGPVA